MGFKGEDEVRRAVRAEYAQVARAASAVRGGCGGLQAAGGSVGRNACCGAGSAVTSSLYSSEEAAAVPAEAMAASRGCGNPTALADLKPGEVVLDLGSGGGIDVLLSARRVGPSGKAYGVDMTDEMLELARQNARRAGATNVEFLKGTIEALPLPDASVDVVISNCVINLAIDKDRALAEAFRVLRPGGRFAVSDVVVRDGYTLPRWLQRGLEAWVGCVAGALQEGEYRAKLAAAGFTDIELEITRVYGETAAGLVPRRWRHTALGALTAAFVRARKPANPA